MRTRCITRAHGIFKSCPPQQRSRHGCNQRLAPVLARNECISTALAALSLDERWLRRSLGAEHSCLRVYLYVERTMPASSVICHPPSRRATRTSNEQIQELVRSLDVSTDGERHLRNRCLRARAPNDGKDFGNVSRGVHSFLVQYIVRKTVLNSSVVSNP